MTTTDRNGASSEQVGWYIETGDEINGPLNEAEVRFHMGERSTPTDKYRPPGAEQWYFGSEAELILNGEAPVFSRYLPPQNEAGEVQCIKCGSTQLHSGKRGYRFWRGGIFGMNKIIITCLKCGTEFLPGGERY